MGASLILNCSGRSCGSFVIGFRPLCYLLTYLAGRPPIDDSRGHAHASPLISPLFSLYLIVGPGPSSPGLAAEEACGSWHVDWAHVIPCFRPSGRLHTHASRFRRLSSSPSPHVSSPCSSFHILSKGRHWMCGHQDVHDSLFRSGTTDRIVADQR